MHGGKNIMILLFKWIEEIFFVQSQLNCIVHLLLDIVDAQAD